MDDKEFKVLEEEIEIKMYELRRLQQRYRNETGRNYVPTVKMDKPIWARKGK